VLTRAIEYRGSTIRDYLGGSGLGGGYQDEHRVYGRAGEACPVCAAMIEVVRVAGRSPHYCPWCQEIHHKDTKDTKKIAHRRAPGVPPSRI
jgi:formamidopyrimidine-DNA glycosylase